MKLKHLLVSLLASAVAFTSCQDEEKDFGLPEVKITTSAISFNQDLASSTLTVTSTRDWMVSTAADWVAIYPSKGKANTETVVTITVLENETYNRKAAVKFDIGYDYKTLTIAQEGPMGEKTNGSGTISDPYTVKGVLDYIQTLGTDESPDVVYIHGKIASISDPFASQYGNASFTVKDEGSEDVGVFTAYRVLYLGNKKWTASDDQISIDDDVIVAGRVYNYGGKTPETVSGTGYIYSHNGKTAGGGGGEGGGTPAGTGTLADPYNVAGAVNAVKDLTWTSTTEYQSTDMVYVKGKISRIADNGNYAASGTYGNATFYIADYSEGGEVEAEFYAFRILYLGNKKYTSGQTDIKVGDEVILHGKLMNYRGNTPETVNNSAYLYSLNGQTSPGDTPTPGEDAIFFESFESSQGDFTIENVVLPSDLDHVWAHDASYHLMKASAYANNVKYATESNLVSPEIDLSGQTSAFLTFEHTGRYFGAISDEAILFVKDDAGWNQVTIPTYFTGNDWTFVSSGDIDLSAYAGHKIQIAFKYISTENAAGTWEIKNVKVSATATPVGPVDPVDPVDPVEGDGIKITLAATDFTADTDATYGAGFKNTYEGYTVAYYKHTSTTPPVNTNYDHIRVYKNSAIVVEAPTGTTLKSLTFNCTEANYTFAMNVLEGGGSTAANTTNKTVTWTGSASRFVGHTVNGQCRIASIDIVYE